LLLKIARLAEQFQASNERETYNLAFERDALLRPNEKSKWFRAQSGQSRSYEKFKNGSWWYRAI